MHYLFFLLPLFFISGCSFDESKKLSVTKALSSDACSFEIPEGKNIVCGNIAVPEDHAAPTAAQVQLSVAVIKSSADVKKDPIIYLEGGPGGSVIADPESWIDFDIADDRDLIIYDQRGTGHSTPFLECDSETTDDGNSLSNAYQEVGRLCREELLEAGIDTDHYNTQSSVKDLEVIRQQLGIDRWIIYGISYGTALAQAYAKTFPEKTSAIVIDSVLPLNHPFFSETINKYSAAFETLFDACAEESACHDAFPELKNDFISLVDTLNNDPRILTYEDLDTDTVAGTFELTGELFASMLWHAMYASGFSDYLPYLISNEVTNDYLTSRFLYSAFYGADEESKMSDVMYYTVMCHDFIPIDSRENMQSSFLNLGEYSGVVSYSDRAYIYDLCDTIVTQEAESDFNALGTHTIPTLVMGGEFDPVTPPALSKEVYNALNKAYFFNLDHQGHGVTTEGCGKEIMRQFIDNPELSPLNSCNLLETSFIIPSAHIASRKADALDSKVQAIIKKEAKRIKEYLPKR